MNPQTLALRVASVVFGLMSLAQLLRAVIRVRLAIAGHPIPARLSLVAFVILALLSAWMWAASSKKG